MISLTESAFCALWLQFCILSSFIHILWFKCGDFPEKQRKLRVSLGAVAFNFCPGFDSFLWGGLKEKAYANSPSSVQEFEDSIRSDVQKISHETFVEVFQNFENRPSYRTENDGDHIEKNG